MFIRCLSLLWALCWCAAATAQDSAFQPPNIPKATSSPSTLAAPSLSSPSPQPSPSTSPQPSPAGVPDQAAPGASLTPNTVGGQPLTPAQFSTSAPSELPRTHGQEYRTYDLTPYTKNIEGVENPQQGVIDWILRDTGSNIWFSGPAALLNADRQELRVYHTPEVQAAVKETVDRFLATQGQSYVMSMRLVTIGSPNWRSKALPMLQPVKVETPGVEAWLVTKENIAVMLGDLRKRTDFQEHNSPNVVIHNGQYHSVSRRQPRSFVRAVLPRTDSFTGYDLDMGQFNEGYSMDFSPLVSSDGTIIDGALTCSVDQIEQFVNIPIDVPMVGGARQRVQVQVPQVVSWRLHERFRWPIDQVLLLSCGVVAMPAPERKSPLDIANPLGLRLPLGNATGRADALLMIECKGKADELIISAQRTANQGSAGAPGLLLR